MPLDWNEVDKALTLVEKAIDSTDFSKWVEENRDNLDCDYENYKNGCAKDFEEPDGFYIWALGCYLTKLEKDGKVCKKPVK